MTHAVRFLIRWTRSFAYRLLGHDNIPASRSSLITSFRSPRAGHSAKRPAAAPNIGKKYFVPSPRDILVPRGNILADSPLSSAIFLLLLNGETPLRGEIESRGFEEGRNDRVVGSIHPRSRRASDGRRWRLTGPERERVRRDEARGLVHGFLESTRSRRWNKRISKRVSCSLPGRQAASSC